MEALAGGMEHLGLPTSIFKPRHILHGHFGFIIREALHQHLQVILITAKCIPVAPNHLEG
jgi:hypothetical protein